MDDITYGIALAREEELESQIDAAKSQLRSLQKEIKKYSGTGPVSLDIKKQSIARSGKRMLPIRDAVKEILTQSGPTGTTQLITKLSERSLINDRNSIDRAYARATLQRLKKELIYQDHLYVWHLKPLYSEWTCFLCGAKHSVDNDGIKNQEIPGNKIRAM